MTIQDFRGKTLVSIREYYSKEGKELPTSKGSFYLYDLVFLFYLFSYIYIYIHVN